MIHGQPGPTTAVAAPHVATEREHPIEIVLVQQALRVVMQHVLDRV